MRMVVQRVNEARVRVGGKVAGKIGKGYLVLLGVGREDDQEKADQLVRKLVNLRIMADKDRKMNLAIKEAGGGVLVVSQFTLYADTRKGNRPSFVKAAEPDCARDLYRYFVAKLIESGVGVDTGRFGEYMKIEAELDGPVTIVINSD